MLCSHSTAPGVFPHRIGRSMQTLEYHDLDHNPNLPLRNVVQGLQSTDPTKNNLLDHAGYTTPTPATWATVDHEDQEYVCPEWSISLTWNRLSVRGVVFFTFPPI